MFEFYNNNFNKSNIKFCIMILIKNIEIIDKTWIGLNQNKSDNNVPNKIWGVSFQFDLLDLKHRLYLIKLI